MNPFMKNKNRRNKISIVIPVFNSEKTIGSIVDELVNELEKKYILEIILVNDASEDTSENVCVNLYRKYRKVVRFYSLAKNAGEHNAVMAGLGKAGGDYIIIMDDDFQNPPREVNRLVKKAIDHEYDVVYTYSDKSGRSLFRKLGSIFTNSITGIIMKKPSGLYLSSFKCMSHFTVKEIIKYELPFPYIDGLILRTTGKVGILKVEEHERRTGKSGYSFRKLSSLWLNMFFGFSTLPLKIVVFTGILFSIAGLITGYFLLMRITNDSVCDMTLFLIIIAVATISIIHFTMLWMLGEYLWRKQAIQNKTPQYIIRKSYDSGNTKRKKQ